MPADTTLLFGNDKLLARIVALSQQFDTVSVPPIDENTDESEIERRRAEAYFRYALAKRTWWRLTHSERALIRKAVLNEHPHYKTNPAWYCLESECISVVQRLIAESSTCADSSLVAM